MKEFKYVYGPVPSRRMGLSIGVSPIPKGHCNYSCIYCQLGRTRKMTNIRQEYYEDIDIINEFKSYIKGNIDYDVVTIVGEGEPSLNSNLGRLIRGLKNLTNKPVAIISNGSFLSKASVREELMDADIVLPSLDATNHDMFKKINRPHGDIVFNDIIRGLVEFSKVYSGQLWIETMLIKGLNDTKEDFLNFKKILNKINYHRLYINSPVRPPAESFAEAASKESIDEAIDILGGISIDKLVSEGFYSETEDDYEAILSIIKRHPMNQFEIKSFLEGRKNDNIGGFFHRLETDANIEIIDYKNYYTYRLR